MRSDPVHTHESSTDAPPGAAARDHMGRQHAATVGEALRHDWPWVVALAVLIVYLIVALSGSLHL